MSSLGTHRPDRASAVVTCGDGIRLKLSQQLLRVTFLRLYIVNQVRQLASLNARHADGQLSVCIEDIAGSIRKHGEELGPVWVVSLDALPPLELLPMISTAKLTFYSCITDLTEQLYMMCHSLAGNSPNTAGRISLGERVDEIISHPSYLLNHLDVGGGRRNSSYHCF